MYEKRINGFCTVNPLRGRVYRMNSTEAKSKSLIGFIEKLLEMNPQRRLWICRDNSPIHRSKVLKKWIADHLRVDVRRVPGQWLEHNPQEQRWNYARAKLLKNRYFPTNRRFGCEKCLQPFDHIRTAKIAELLSKNAILLDAMIVFVELKRGFETGK